MSLGFHVSKSHTVGGRKVARGMVDALREDMALLRGFGFAPCAQIFVSGPQSFRETITDEEKRQIRQFVRETNTTLVIHGSYVDNPWNLSAGSIHNIKQELRTAAAIGATGVIVHLAAGASNDASLRQVLEEISNLPEDVLAAVTLWLEIHTAKSSDKTYETPEKVQRLFERVAQCDLKGLRVGLCIDTAHLFACGFSFRGYAEAWGWLTSIPDVPVMMHLNDSASTFGSGRDQHAVLTQGNIWGDFRHLPIEESGLMAVLDWADEKQVVVILERDEVGVSTDLELIRGLGFFQI